MPIATDIIILVIALLHIYFMVLEMFLWDKPAGLRAFKLSREKAEMTKALAANQGLYNGFLAAGLLWGLFAVEAAFQIKLFFLGCVLIAGIYGALSVSRRILIIQGAPAALALSLLLLS